MRAGRAGALASVLFAAGLLAVPPAPAGTEPSEAALRIRADAESLAAPEGPGRGGPSGGEGAATLLAGAFRKAGLLPAGDAGGYLQRFGASPEGPGEAAGRPRFANVVGVLPGSDRAVNTEMVVVAARGPGPAAGGAAGPRPRPEEGDPASVAALLELARSLAARRIGLRRSLVVVAFGAGGPGDPGPLHFARHPPVPLDRIVAVVHLDRLDRVRSGRLELHGEGTSPLWKPLLAGASAPPGLVPVRLGQLPGRSAATPFADASRPALFVTGGLPPGSPSPLEAAAPDYEAIAAVDTYLSGILRSLLAEGPAPSRNGPPVSPAASPRP